MNEAVSIIEGAVDANANIIFGAAIDESLDDEIRVTVIATGFDGKPLVLPSLSGETQTTVKSTGSTIFPRPKLDDIPTWIRGR